MTGNSLTIADTTSTGWMCLAIALCRSLAGEKGQGTMKPLQVKAQELPGGTGGGKEPPGKWQKGLEALAPNALPVELPMGLYGSSHVISPGGPFWASLQPPRLRTGFILIYKTQILPFCPQKGHQGG